MTCGKVAVCDPVEDASRSVAVHHSVVPAKAAALHSIAENALGIVPTVSMLSPEVSRTVSGSIIRQQPIRVRMFCLGSVVSCDHIIFRWSPVYSTFIDVSIVVSSIEGRLHLFGYFSWNNGSRFCCSSVKLTVLA